MTTKTATYRGCTIRQTQTTTDVTCYAYGVEYQAVAMVWEIDGRLTKPAGRRPFLTSAEACREWIREEDTLAEPTSPEEEEQRRRDYERACDAEDYTMSKPKHKTSVPVLIRIPSDLLEQADEKARQLAAAQPGLRVTRTDVVRLALHAYLTPDS